MNLVYRSIIKVEILDIKRFCCTEVEETANKLIAAWKTAIKVLSLLGNIIYRIVVTSVKNHHHIGFDVYFNLYKGSSYSFKTQVWVV